nr:hypothetical protein [Candidatus Sigynarchaeota archaeon]
MDMAEAVMAAAMVVAAAMAVMVVAAAMAVVAVDEAAVAGATAAIVVAVGSRSVVIKKIQGHQERRFSRASTSKLDQESIFFHFYCFFINHPL